MEVGVRPAEGDVGVLKREARRRPKIWPDADCSDPTKKLLRSQRRWWTPLSAVEVGPHLLCSLLSLQQFSSEVVSLDMVEAISMILPPAISYGGLPVCWLVRRA